MELPLQNKYCLSQVNMLRLEAAKSGLLPTSRPVRGRGGYRARGIRGAVSTYVPRGSWRGRGRGGRGFTLSPGSSTLDRRPSRYVGHSWEFEINAIGKILLTWIRTYRGSGLASLMKLYQSLYFVHCSTGSWCRATSWTRRRICWFISR